MHADRGGTRINEYDARLEGWNTDDTDLTRINEYDARLEGWNTDDTDLTRIGAYDAQLINYLQETALEVNNLFNSGNNLLFGEKYTIIHSK